MIRSSCSVPGLLVPMRSCQPSTSVLHTSGPLVRFRIRPLPCAAAAEAGAVQSRHMQRITPVTSEDPDPQPRVNLDQSGPRTRAVSERGSAPPSPWWGVV